MKATKQPDFRICPNCGARNKAKWEYCVSCSEPLTGVPLGDEAAPSGSPLATVTDEDDGEGLPWGSILAAMVALGIGIGVYRLAKEPTVAPPPELFSIGTLPPSAPPAGPVAEKDQGREEYEAGLKLLNQNDPRGAAALFARAVAFASDNHLYRHALAVALWQSGSRDEAIDAYRVAVVQAPTNPTYRLNYAKALAATGRSREALSEYEDLIRSQPGHGEALQEAARLLAESNPARARELLQQAAAARPGDAVLKQQLASVLEKSGDTEGATTMYQEILQSHPDAHITRGLLAEIQLKRGQPAEAVELFRSGLQQFPDVPLLHRGLASALERSGAVTEAITAYREYARLAPNAPDAQQLRERADRLEKRVAPSAS